jgi:hypothetical protein
MTTLRDTLHNLAREAACVFIVACIFLFIAWVAGCNFDGTWDDLQWDHPTNYNDTALHPEAR